MFLLKIILDFNKNNMNLDVIVPMAFLSYYRYSFFFVDFLVFLITFFTFYQLTYHKLQIPEEKLRKYQLIRKTILILFGSQLVCYLVILLSLFFQKPLLLTIKTDVGISGYVFVIMIMLRLVTIMMTSAFLISCWRLTGENHTRAIKQWFLFLFILLIYSLWTLFYMIFPSFNKALSIYEMFYNIRNLYIVNDPQKKQKTFEYLGQMGCIHPAYYPLYQHEWKRTFKNAVMPFQCP